MNRRLILSFALIACLHPLDGLAQPLEQDPDSLSMYFDLSEIVITAQYAPTDSRSALHDIRTIKPDVIQRRAANNLEQLLQRDPSIRINQDPVLGSSLNLLGVDGQGVKIMIDGVPVIGRQNGNIDLSQINLANIERVEIVEGPLGVSYGTDALGGVINLITKKSQLDKLQIGLQSQVESRGENSYQANIGFQLTPNLLFQVNAGYDRFDGYSGDTLRSVTWNPKAQTYGSASLRYNLAEDAHLRYAFRHFQEDVTNLGEIRRPQYEPYAFDDYYLTQRQDHNLTFDGAIGEKYYLQTIAAYNQFKRIKNSFRFNFEDASEELLDGQQDTSFFNAIQLRSTFASQYAESKLNFQLGIDLRRDDAIGARIQDTLDANGGFSSISDYALFGSLQYEPFRKTQIQLGMRYAYNNRYKAPLVPSINLRQSINKYWTIRASYAQGFRAPSIKELYFNFIDINHFIVGNLDLKAEKSDNIQAGISYQKSSGSQEVRFSLKGFYNDIRDRIGLYEYEIVDGELIPATDTTTLLYTYFNQSVYKTQGLRLQFGRNFSDFRFNTGLSMIGYYNEDHQDFADIDPFTYALELNTEIAYQVMDKGPEISLFIRNNDKLITYFPEINEDGETISAQRIQDGYTLIDASIKQTLFKDRISLVGGVRNLLDIQQTNVSAGDGSAHSGNGGVALVGLGRSFFLSARVDLGLF